MTGVRLMAVLPAAAFALLTLVLVCIGALPGNEAAWASASIALAFVPSGVCVPCGWRRRAAEAMLLPVAWALAMIGDATLRSMALPPLLLLAAFTAAAAARRKGTGTVITVCLALAVRSAAGLGFVGFPFWRLAIVVIAVAALAAAGTRVLGAKAGELLALLAGAAPLERAPLVALLALVVLGVVLARRGRPRALGVFFARGWYAGALAAALILVALAPWGGILPLRAFPAAGWASAALLLVAALATPLLPAAVAGAAWLGFAFALGPVQPPPADRPALDLTAAAPRALLPASEGGRYRAEIALANAAALPQGTLVATVRDIGRELSIRAGVETAEWAHERPDVRDRGPHALPATPVWRPVGYGRTATWGVAGVVSGELPAGVRPQIERAAGLPPAVVVSVAAAGSVRPTPPRDWPLPAWLLAAAVAVAVLQLAAGLWRVPSAALPWALLTAGAVAARIPVEPLRLLVERHGVDLAAAAVLSAWLPAAWRWLRQRHVFLAAAALLVPLALATPHLTPPLYGDEPFHLIVLDSLARDHDLNLANNYDLEHHPYNRIYVTGTIFLHSPVLAFLLLPGYLVGGRAGALVLLALAGAALVALVTRRLEQLGAHRGSTVPVAMTLLLTYPLATFATQIWVEVVAATFVAACLVLLARPGPSARLGVAALAVLATAAKTRLGLLFVPLALAAWRPRRLRPRELGITALAVSAVVAAGLAVSWLFLGHPLGQRRLPDLVPHNLVQPITALGGLVFDPAGGLAFAAPLALLSLVGLARLWRRGGDGERALMIGAGLTVLALLHSSEWYGGGAPPARYLVPALPLFALAGALAFTAPARGRRLAWLLLPPSMFVWWVFVTRPHFTVNPGDGGYWLADAVARRFATDARHLVPSFLRFNTATIVMPILLCLGALLLFACARHWPAFGRGLVRATTPLWLMLACVALVVLHLRLDRIVEIEDPQVVHIGGALEPPPGTFARYSLPNGWRIADDEGVEVPLNLAAGDKLRLEGWLEGAARSGATIAAQWDGGAPRALFVAASGRGDVALPDAPGSGRHRLRLLLHAPQGGEAVLDRLVVQR